MVRPIFDPRMFTRLADFYPSLCTIQENTPTQSTDSGALTNAWSNLASHVDLACSIAPSGGVEVKTPDQSFAISTHVVSISTFKADVEARMRAVVDGDAYDILSAQTDSHSKTTHLMLERINEDAS